MTSVVITQVGDTRWQAVSQDQVLGNAEAFRRSDGRTFLSVDSWQDPVFDQLAATMLAHLPAPLHTLVDESDHDLTASWRRAGFVTGRRELEYQLPLSPRVPSEVTVLPLGTARPDLLRELYDTIRAEVDWSLMPAELLVRPTPLDPANHIVAERDGRYLGLLRVLRRRQHARINLIAVRTERRRRGVARAMLAAALAALPDDGVDIATSAVDESNEAGRALLVDIGARQVGSALELVRH